MNLMLKVIGFGLLGLFVLMIFPSTMTDVATEPMFYGTANIVVADSDGNALMKQTVHNRITDEGETYLIDQVFDTGAVQQVENSRIGALCIYETSDSNIVEGTVNTLANGLTNVSGNFCHVTTAMSNSAQTSVTDAELYTSGVDFTSGETISAILICAKNAGDTNFLNCSDGAGGASTALAALIINNVTLTGSDTITITYTFDITTLTT